jgi:hypothetical protein
MGVGSTRTGTKSVAVAGDGQTEDTRRRLRVWAEGAFGGWFKTVLDM